LSSQTTENAKTTVHRNERSFDKLNRGRPRRKNRAWFTEEELRLAKEILMFLATRPPPCICGERDWTYNIKDKLLRARCRQCQYEQRFSHQAGKWTHDSRGGDT
jgi:hypothetical protein